MRVHVFVVSYFIRHGEDGPVLLQAPANIGAESQEGAIATLRASIGDGVVLEVTGVANAQQDVLIATGEPAPLPNDGMLITSLEGELKAAKEAAATLDQENTAFASQVLSLQANLTRVQGDNATLSAKLAAVEADLAKLQESPAPAPQPAPEPVPQPSPVVPAQ